MGMKWFLPHPLTDSNPPTDLHQFFLAWAKAGDPSRCFYCGVSLLDGFNIPESHPHFKTKDHFIPRSRRKLFALLPVPLRNMPLTVSSCCACNNIKGNQTPEALRPHVRRMNEAETFFCEARLSTSFKSLPDYLIYCKAAAELHRREKIVMTQRSMAAVAQRRAAGLLPANHKQTRKKAMQENDWWNAMNSLGKLIYTLGHHDLHPEVVDKLRETIAVIKNTLPEEFSRRKMGSYEALPTMATGREAWDKMNRGGTLHLRRSRHRVSTRHVQCRGSQRSPERHQRTPRRAPHGAPSRIRESEMHAFPRHRTCDVASGVSPDRVLQLASRKAPFREASSDLT